MTIRKGAPWASSSATRLSPCGSPNTRKTAADPDLTSYRYLLGELADACPVLPTNLGPASDLGGKAGVWKD